MKQERMGEVMNVSSEDILDDLTKLFARMELVEIAKYRNWEDAVNIANDTVKRACHLGLWTKDGNGFVQSVRIFSVDGSIDWEYVDKALEETLTSPQYEAERNCKGEFKVEFTLKRTH